MYKHDQTKEKEDLICVTNHLAGTVFSFVYAEEVDSIKKMEKKNQEVYLEGLKRYYEKGVRILIDGEEAPMEDWERIFTVEEGGGFYMGDYIGTSTGQLMEIRFDKVNNA